MATNNLIATIGSASDGQGQVAVDVGRPANVTTEVANVAAAAAEIAVIAALTTAQMGALSTTQIGTLTTNSALLTAASDKLTTAAGADVLVNYNATTVVSKSKLKTALGEVAKRAADLTE